MTTRCETVCPETSVLLRNNGSFKQAHAVEQPNGRFEHYLSNAPHTVSTPQPNNSIDLAEASVAAEAVIAPLSAMSFREDRNLNNIAQKNTKKKQHRQG